MTTALSVSVKGCFPTMRALSGPETSGSLLGELPVHMRMVFTVLLQSGTMQEKIQTE